MSVPATLEQRGLDTSARLGLGGILAFALVLNIWRIWSDPPTIRSGETQLWWPLVLNVVEGRGYVACFEEYFPFCGPHNQRTAAREPVPVFLFAAVAWMTGKSLWIIALVQLALNLAILLVVYLIGREVASARAALVAALFWAVCLPAIRLVPQVGSDLVCTLGVASGGYYFIRARRTGRKRDWVMAGVCLAAGVLSRSVVLGLAGGLALSLIPWRRQRFPLAFELKAWQPLLIFAAACGAVISFWVLRNYLVFDRWIVGSTLTGYNLFRHNYPPLVDGRYRYVSNEEAQLAVEALLARHPELSGAETEAEMDRVYRDEAMAIIRAEPARYVMLSAYRFLPLWFNWQVKEAYGLASGTLDYVIMLLQGFYLLGAVVGMWKQRGHAWPLTVGVMLITLLYMAVNGRQRFIVIGLPYVSVLSAMGWLHLVPAFRPIWKHFTARA